MAGGVPAVAAAAKAPRTKLPVHRKQTKKGSDDEPAEGVTQEEGTQEGSRKQMQWDAASDDRLWEKYEEVYLRINKGNLRKEEYRELLDHVNEGREEQGKELYVKKHVKNHIDGWRKTHKAEVDKESQTGAEPSKWAKMDIADRLWGRNPKQIGIPSGLDNDEVKGARPEDYDDKPDGREDDEEPPAEEDDEEQEEPISGQPEPEQAPKTPKTPANDAADGVPLRAMPGWEPVWLFLGIGSTAAVCKTALHVGGSRTIEFRGEAASGRGDDKVLKRLDNLTKSHETLSRAYEELRKQNEKVNQALTILLSANANASPGEKPKLRRARS